MKTPTADYIAALCGISRKTALDRLRKYERGEMTRERMLKPYPRPVVRENSGGNAEWLALGDKPTTSAWRPSPDQQQPSAGCSGLRTPICPRNWRRKSPWRNRWRI